MKDPEETLPALLGRIENIILAIKSVPLFAACRLHEGPEPPRWSLLGVYSTRERAETRCTEPNDSVAELELDADDPDGPFAKAYYPRLTDVPTPTGVQPDTPWPRGEL